MERQKLTLGGIRLVRDASGYGVEQLMEDDPQEVWECIASFKFARDFIRFLAIYLTKAVDLDETREGIMHQLNMFQEQQSGETTEPPLS